MQVDGGAWLRLQRAGMMSTIRVWSMLWSRAPSFVTLALPSGNILLSPCMGCCAGLEAVGQRALCATTEADQHDSRLGRCVRSAMRTGLCRNLGGVAVLRSGVVPKITHFASPRTVGREKMTC